MIRSTSGCVKVGKAMRVQKVMVSRMYFFSCLSVLFNPNLCLMLFVEPSV